MRSLTMVADPLAGLQRGRKGKEKKRKDSHDANQNAILILGRSESVSPSST